MFFDPLYLVFLLPALALSLYAQHKVKSTYSKFSQVRNMYGMTGGQVAHNLLRACNLDNVTVEGTPGELTDHYDPRGKVLRLSQGVYHSPTVAALGIVAHEVGHAVQDQQGYLPMRLRASVVPAANLGSQLGPWLFFIGLIMNFAPMAWLGILFFAAAAVFTLVTLPVELDASNRARRMLQTTGLASVTEYDAASSVLSAAALTYVASLVMAMMQLLYFVMRASGMGRSEE